MKKCIKCGEIKPLTMYYKDKYMKSGYKSSCIMCEKTRYSHNCQYCGKLFKSSSKDSKYCSKECRGGNITCVCGNCGKQYTSNRYSINNSNRNFCSKQCYWEYNTGDNNPLYAREEISCDYCSKSIYRQNGRVSRNKYNYCNIECKNNHHSILMNGDNNSNYKGKVPTECANCGTFIELIPSLYGSSKMHFCSIGCKHKYNSIRYAGENNPNYNPTLTLEDRELTRHIPGYKEWVLDVYQRDKYTCVYCGDSTSGNLVAHHLNSYHWDIDNRLSVDNGVTLCRGCHKEFHTRYGYKNNTKNQFDVFINNKPIRVEGCL